MMEEERTEVWREGWRERKKVNGMVGERGIMKNKREDIKFGK